MCFIDVMIYYTQKLVKLDLIFKEYFKLKKMSFAFFLQNQNKYVFTQVIVCVINYYEF